MLKLLYLPRLLLAYLIIGIARTFWVLDLATQSFAHIFVLAVFSSYFYIAFASGIPAQIKYASEYRTYYPTTFGSQNVLGSKNVVEDFPKKVTEAELPDITAKSFLIVDGATSKILAEKNSKVRCASASTTKLMTALVALDIYKENDLVEISKECSELDATKANLPPETKYKAFDLIFAMLVASAGDAACALSNSKINYDEFLYDMNVKSSQIGLESTYFTNAIGFDGVNGAQFSTALDLYKLSKKAVENNEIAQAVKTKEFRIKSDDEKYIGILQNTNKMLWELPQSVGVKTGTTTEAGEVLIYEFKDEVKDIFIVVMGSEDRFSDTRALLSWTTLSYTWSN